MTGAERKRLKKLFTIGSIAWMVLVGWIMWVTLPDNAVATHDSDSLKDRMSLCSGSFQDRFDCKEQLIIQSGRDAFYTLSLRFLLIILPPLAGSIWLSGYLARRPLPVVEEAHRVEDGDWKARAQLHTEVQSPTEAAHALHLHEEDLPTHPASRGGHHLIDDIAPVADWKSRAQANVRAPKHEE